MRRKHWILAAISALAVVAFAVDRLYFGEPAAAQAEVASAGPAGGPRGSLPRRQRPDASDKAAVKTVALPDPALEALGRLDEAGLQRDVFAPTPGMLRLYQQLSEAEQTAAAREGPKPGSPEAFLSAHNLQGTFTGPGGPLAVIDGEPVRLGDILDGFRLTRIQPYSAEFRRGRERVTLTIPQLASSPE